MIRIVFSAETASLQPLSNYGLAEIKYFLRIDITQSKIRRGYESEKVCLGNIRRDRYARLLTCKHSYGSECQACTSFGGAST